jgi:hypothetical protein
MIDGCQADAFAMLKSIFSDSFVCYMMSYLDRKKIDSFSLLSNKLCEGPLSIMGH